MWQGSDGGQNGSFVVPSKARLLRQVPGVSSIYGTWETKGTVWARGLEESGSQTTGILNRCLLQTVSVQFKIFRRYPHLSTQCSPVWLPPVSSTSCRLGLGSVQMLEQPLWFPSAQKKMKDQGKHVVPLWYVASLYSVFCDGLLSNLTTFWWVPGKLAYDKFYIEKREIATKKIMVSNWFTLQKKYWF